MPLDDPSQLATIRLTALGVPTEITLGGSRRAELVPAVETAWSRCIELYDATPTATQTRMRVFLDDDPVQRARAFDEGSLVGDDLDVVMDALSRHVTLMAIGERQSDLVMLHAAGLVEPRSGRAVILVGASGTGKTTAARTLGHDWGYLSDETVGIDHSGRVVEYPKPLSIVNVDKVTKDQVSPSNLGLLRASGGEQPHVGAIVLLVREPASGEPATVGSMPVLEAVARLAEQTSCLRAHDRPLHRLADLIAQVREVHTVVYSEAESLAPALARLVSR